MDYRISLTARAKKALHTLPMEESERINRSLLSLRHDPFSRVKHLKESELYSLRVGDYRIILTIRRDQFLILVIRIGRRENVYRGL